MAGLALLDLDTGRVVSEDLHVAVSFGKRLVGLMGREALGCGEGLLLERCPSIHTFFMRFPIDLAYLDGSFRGVAEHAGVQPWRVVRPAPFGLHALEMAEGAFEARGLETGHRLLVVTAQR